MIVTGILSLTIINWMQGNSKTQSAELRDLGQHRTAFVNNNRLLASFSNPGDKHDWEYHTLGRDNYETVIFFPVGASDKRFYLSGYSVPHHVGETDRQEIFLYETLKTGYVSPEWKVYADRLTNSAKSFDFANRGFGTLDHMLARMGLYVRGTGSGIDGQTLKYNGGLAAYAFHSNGYPDVMEYFYVTKEGVALTPHFLSLPRPKANEVIRGKPPFDFPFPISPEEEQAIKDLYLRK